MVAESAISWGEAVLPTAISTVAAGRLFYRGRDAVTLASHASLEEAAALLWDVPEFPQLSQMLPFRTDLPPVEAALSMLAACCPRLRPDARQGEGVACRRGGGAAALAGGAHSAPTWPMASTIADRLCPRLELRARSAGEAIRVALVLMADHELNASTFAARVTASTGASLAAAALSGLATLLGPVHGGATLRVRALIDDAERNGAKAGVQRMACAWRRAAGFRPPALPRHRPARRGPARVRGLAGCRRRSGE